MSIIENLNKPQPKSRDTRLGVFHISRHMISDNPDAVRVALRDCIVVRAEMRYDTDCIEYLALHPDFTAVGEGGVARNYECVIERVQVGDLWTYRREWR